MTCACHGRMIGPYFLVQHSPYMCNAFLCVMKVNSTDVVLTDSACGTKFFYLGNST